MHYRLLVIALALLVPGAAQAQTCTGVCSISSPARGSHLAQTAAINAALGGLTGGALAAIRGGSFIRGFAQGAAGGGITYAGKVVAAGRWQGAGLVGRQVAAVGSSISANAAERRAPFERIMLPVGPVRVHVETGSGLRATPRVDVASAVSLVAFAAQSGSRLDVAASISDGAPVFRIPEAGVDGRHFAGVVAYVNSEGQDPSQRAAIPGTRAHERVHVIQNDQVYLLLGRPLDDALLGSDRRGLLRFIDTGTHALLVGGTNSLVDYEWRPWEDEAYLIADNRPAPGPATRH